MTRREKLLSTMKRVYRLIVEASASVQNGRRCSGDITNILHDILRLQSRDLPNMLIMWTR